MSQDTIAPSLPAEGELDLPRPASDAAEPAAPDTPRTIIEPSRGWLPIDFAEIWRYRELLYFFTLRNIKVRYKQTALGPIWAIIPPIMTTGIFTLLFGLLMGRGNEPTVPGVPYALSTFCAMLPWQLFANSLSLASNSLQAQQGLMTKVYFPRLLLPFSAVLPALVDVAIVFPLLLGMMLFLGFVPDWRLLTIPFFAALVIAASLSVSLWVAAVSALYRDFRYALPFVVKFGMYLSPVIYSLSTLQGRLPDWALALYCLNPLVGSIEGFRWAMLGKTELSLLHVAPGAALAAILLYLGMHFFRRMEKTFVDVV